MPTPKILTLSERLRRRYSETQDHPDALTTQGIADSVGITGAYVSQLHAGRADTVLAKWQGDKAYRYLKLGYRYSISEIREIAREHGLGNVQRHLEFLDRAAPIGVKGGSAQVRFLGAVSAGRFGEAYVADEPKLVDIPSEILEHHDPKDVFAVRVSGDSMVCEDVPKSIPEGAVVFFHSSLRPSPGDIICCYLEAEDMSVIKIYRPGKEFTLLESMNGKHRPIVVDADHPARLEGVYLGQFSKKSR